MGLRHDRLPLTLAFLAGLACSSCGGGGGGPASLDPLDLDPWGRGGEDLAAPPSDVTADDPAPPPLGPCDAPPDTALRAYFSRNVLQYAGNGTVCGGQNLGIRVAQLLAAAEERVELAGMEVQDHRVLDALAAAAGRGADVRVFLDDGYYDPGPARDLAALLAAGVRVSHDAAGTALMHDKFVVVDDRWLWTGSANFSAYDAISNANATLLFDSPSLAAIYRDRFERLWGEDGIPGSGDSHQWQEGPETGTAGQVDVEVWFTPSWDAADRLVELIEGAETSIHFEIFAFTLDSVAAALAARCGQVELVGLYDRSQADDPASMAPGPWCGDAVVLPADLAGDFGYNKLHHKLLIVDGATVATGSMNWSVAGASENDENLVVFTDLVTAGLFEAELATRLAEALD